MRDDAGSALPATGPAYGACVARGAALDAAVIASEESIDGVVMRSVAAKMHGVSDARKVRRAYALP